MIKELSITVALIAGALVAFFLIRKSKCSKEFVFSEETIDGELKMTQVIDFFKSLNLKQKQDVPFVAQGDCDEFQKMFGGPFPNKPEGYVTLFIGVYNEKKGLITSHKLIHAKAVDSGIQQMLGDEKLVVLQ